MLALFPFHTQPIPLAFSRNHMQNGLIFLPFLFFCFGPCHLGRATARSWSPVQPRPSRVLCLPDVSQSSRGQGTPLLETLQALCILESNPKFLPLPARSPAISPDRPSGFLYPSLSLFFFFFLLHSGSCGHLAFPSAWEPARRVPGSGPLHLLFLLPGIFLPWIFSACFTAASVSVLIWMSPPRTGPLHPPVPLS